MKLQLLLVLAVVVLVPSLSVGRVFSKCELKTIFQMVITLHGKMQKHKEEFLAAIICQLNVTSGLNSSLVTVEGIRESTTTAQSPPLIPTGNPTEPSTQTTPMPTNATAADVTTAGPVSPSSSPPFGNRRRRRSSSRSHKKHSKASDETVFDVERECDMQEVQEDDNCMRKRKGGSSESSEEDQQTLTWSLGKYGIFQLTDSHFCDSGYRWSRNSCHSVCSAFTDDNLKDDIKCFMDSKYLGCFLELIPQFCLDQAKTYFSDCS